MAEGTFSAFYRRFIVDLVVYVMELGARLPEAAGIAQTAMEQTAKDWSTISDLENYVKGVAFQEWTRRIARAEEHPADRMPEHSSLLPSTLDPTTWEKDEFIRALDLLSPLQRQIIAWKLQGYALAEIAHKLKITPEEVLANWEQARKTLAPHAVIAERER